MRPTACVGVLALATGCYEGTSASASGDETETSVSAGSADDTGDSGDETAGSSDGEEELHGIGGSDLRRLSRREYEASVRTLLGDAVVDANATWLAGLPDDRGRNEFTSMERGITAAHTDTYFVVARALADTASSDAGQIEPCLGEANADEACVATAIESFGRRAYRRPLDEIERDELMAVYRSGADALSHEDGIALLLMAILQSPAFLYHVELGEDAVPELADTYRLGGYELAARLAYALTGAPPDDELLDLAAADLDDDEVYREQVERLSNSEAARGHVRGFFTEWLGLDRIPSSGHSEDFLAGIDPSAVRDEMRTEVEAFVEFHVFDAESTYAAMMTSDVAFPGPNLAAIYGVEEGGPIAVADGRRDGLLTRAAFMMTQGEHTHPILRGVFVLRNFLCDDLQPPPPSPESDILPPPYDPYATARERWTDQTSAPNCAGCHAHINAFGFALEKYDSLGRYRTLEPIIDPETGELVNELPIDDAVEVFIDGERHAVEGGVGLVQALAESEAARECIARKWFRFVHGRREIDEETDQITTLSDIGSEAAVRDMLREIAMRPAFRLRRIEE